MESQIIKLILNVVENVSGTSAKKTHSENIQKIKNYIHEHFSRNFTMCELSENVKLPQNYIRKEFKKCYNTTINNYVFELRMHKAFQLLTHSRLIIKEIALDCGYDYVQNFSRAFKKRYGKSPEKIRNKK